MSNCSWDAVFFDFDGVIADSVQVKTRAFATMFAPYGEEVAQQVVAYHLANGGMPRYRKFIYYYEELLGMEVDRETLAQKGREFSAMVLEEVVKADLIPGALTSLLELERLRIPAFVVSGTPQEEMETIVQQKKLECFFREVHGSPRTKTDIVQDILDRYQLQPDRCLFVGDALADYTAAAATGTCFLAIQRPGSLISFPDGTPISEKVTLRPPAP